MNDIVNKIINIQNQRITNKQVEFITDFILLQVKNNKAHQIDFILKNINEKAHPFFIEMLLRCCFTIKGQLPNYQDLLKRSIYYFQIKKLNPKKRLSGII